MSNFFKNYRKRILIRKTSTKYPNIRKIPAKSELLGHHQIEHFHIAFALRIVDDVSPQHGHTGVKPRDEFNFAVKGIFIEDGKVCEHTGLNSPEPVLHTDYAGGFKGELIDNFPAGGCA